jgi:hypothetical protein
MNHKSRLEQPAGSYGGFTKWHRSCFFALSLDLGAAFSSDCARDARPENQIVVCGVDDRITLNIGDITLNQGYSRFPALRH